MEITEILEQRARALARVPPATPDAAEMWPVVLFTLAGEGGGERYAIGADCVREVLRVKEVTPVPGTPSWLLGLANLRGQMLAIFDPQQLFELPAPNSAEPMWVLVLGENQAEFGIRAEAVLGVVSLRKEAVLPRPDTLTGMAADYARGITADALILLEGQVLLRDPRLTIDLSDHEGAL